MRVGALTLEQYVEDSYLHWVRSEMMDGRIGKQAQNAGNAARIIKLENERAKLIARLDNMVVMRADGEITPEELKRNRGEIDAKSISLTKEIEKLRSAQSANNQLMNVHAFWKTLATSQKHDRIKLGIEAVVVGKSQSYPGPSQKTGHTNTLNTKRVKWIEWVNPNKEALRQRTPQLKLVKT